MNTASYIPLIAEASREAGQLIMEVYRSADFDTALKADNSPLTKADKLAHEAIMEKLKATDFPILSEEGKDIPYEQRRQWETFWLVDPLDGTKEFIKKNGEFTVNIALIHQAAPVLGVVFVPALDQIFIGGKDIGVYRDENCAPEAELTLKENPGDRVRIVVSRSHLDETTQSYIAEFKQPETVPVGSSLKFMRIAENKADVYPRFAPTMEWDTGAAHAILRGMGLEVMTREDGTPLRYNKPNLKNPHFLVKK